MKEVEFEWDSFEGRWKWKTGTVRPDIWQDGYHDQQGKEIDLEDSRVSAQLEKSVWLWIVDLTQHY